MTLHERLVDVPNIDSIDTDVYCYQIDTIVIGLIPKCFSGRHFYIPGLQKTLFQNTWKTQKGVFLY